MSLTTGHCLICNHWTELPLLQDVIDHVNMLGCCSHAHCDLTFAWRDGNPIIDLDSPDYNPFDSDYAPLDLESTSDMDDDLSFLSNGDLTTAGVDEMHNNDNNNNNNEMHNDDDNNSNHDGHNNNNQNNHDKHDENENNNDEHN